MRCFSHLHSRHAKRPPQVGFPGLAEGSPVQAEAVRAYILGTSGMLLRQEPSAGGATIRYTACARHNACECVIKTLSCHSSICYLHCTDKLCPLQVTLVPIRFIGVSSKTTCPRQHAKTLFCCHTGIRRRWCVWDEVDWPPLAVSLHESLMPQTWQPFTLEDILRCEWPMSPSYLSTLVSADFGGRTP